MRPQAPNRWPWPPLITGGAVLVALLMARLWGPPALFPGAFAAGGLLVGLALGLDLWAMVEMRRRRANILPHRAATAHRRLPIPSLRHYREVTGRSM